MSTATIVTEAELRAILKAEAADAVRPIQAAARERIAELLAERDRILSRIKEKEQKAADDAANAAPDVPYMFPLAKCSNCHRAYRQLKRKRVPLSINETKYVKPGNAYTSGLLCPDCKKLIFGNMEDDGIKGMASKEAAFTSNPTQYAFIQTLTEKASPEDAAELHDLQVQNDTLEAQRRQEAKAARLQAMRDRQAALKDRLIRREQQELEVLGWITKTHSIDLVEGARVCILDGTDPKQAARDRRAVVRMVYDDMKLGEGKHPIPFPFKQPKIMRRHGRQRTWLKAEPATSNSGPDSPTKLIEHIGDDHATNARFHTQTFEPEKKAKGSETKTFVYTKPAPTAVGQTQTEIATQVGERVAALYRHPVARSLQTLLGEQVDIADAKGLSNAVQELLAVEDLTKYANEGCMLYPLTFNGESYSMTVTASVEKQVYVAVYDGVLGWGTYEETSKDDFALAIRRGTQSEAFITVTKKDLAAYPEAERNEYVTLFDHMLYLLNMKG